MAEKSRSELASEYLRHSFSTVEFTYSRGVARSTLDNHEITYGRARMYAPSPPPRPDKTPFSTDEICEKGRGPTASRDNSELCLSSSGYWPLFPTESRAFSPLFSFVNLRGVPRFGGHPFFLQPVHTETILRFETLVASKNAPRRSSIHLLLFHPCPSFDLTAEIFLEIREGGVFRSRITPRRYFGR